MKIAIIRDVKTPTRGTKKSAGIDFYIPEDFPPFNLKPQESILIPSGIMANIPEGFMLMAANKSGVSTKKSVIVGAGIVDEDYQGEIHLHLINIGVLETSFLPGDKIVQFILIPVNYTDVELVLSTDLFPEISSRGKGGFGSTGNK